MGVQVSPILDLSARPLTRVGYRLPGLPQRPHRHRAKTVAERQSHLAVVEHDAGGERGPKLARWPRTTPVAVKWRRHGCPSSRPCTARPRLVSLTPVAGLEKHLRRLLESSRLAVRAVRESFMELNRNEQAQ